MQWFKSGRHAGFRRIYDVLANRVGFLRNARRQSAICAQADGDGPRSGAASRCRQTARVAALLVLGFCLHNSAFAVSTCAATSGLPQTLTFPGTIKVGSNLQPGDTIPGTTVPFAITGSCVLGIGSPNTIQVGSAIVACTENGGSTEVMSGVYSTGIAGIGMRIRNSAGTAITNATGSACTSVIATIGAGGAFNFSGTLELVRLSGTIPANASLTPGNFAFIFGVYNTGYVLNSDVSRTPAVSSYIAPSGNIVLNNLTCTVSNPASVTLPTVSSGGMPAVGSVTGTTPFTIGLNCTGSAVVGITLDAAPIVHVDNPAAGLLSVVSGGATGYDIQVLQANHNPMPLQTRVPQGSIAANQQYNYSFFAQYQRVAASTTPGAVTSALIFTFDYQ